MSKKCAIYCRVSTEDQKENGTSLDIQARLGIEHAQKQEYEVIQGGIFLEDISGYLLERPKLDEIRSLARSGEIDVVICDVLDRLSRNQVHQTVLFYEFQQAGVDVEFASEKLDDTSEGQFFRSVMGFFAEKEREKFRERSRRGKLERARRGGILAAGTPVFGYRWAGEKKERYEIDPEAAKVVVRIFEFAAAGNTSRVIAQILNAEVVLTRIAYFHTIGVATRRQEAKDWDAAQVVQVLKDPTYKGERNAYRYEKVDLRHRDPITGLMRTTHSSRRRPLNSPALVPLPNTTVPPIVSEELWEKAQETLLRHKTERRSQGINMGIGMLRAGFAKCGYCGKNLIVGSSKMGRAIAPIQFYRCTSNKNHRGGSIAHYCEGGAYLLFADKLDAEVWSGISAFVEESDTMVANYAELLKKGDESKERDDSTMRSLQTALEKEQHKKKNLLIAIANAEEEDTIAALTQAMEGCSRSISQLELEIIKVQQLLESHKEYKELIVKVVEYLKMAKSTMDLASFEERRALLYALGVRVTCYRSDDLRPNGLRYEISVNLGGIIQHVTAQQTKKY